MTDNTTRWTIRLSDEDKRMLQALCESYGLNRPDAVRRAIREALVARQRITLHGSFIPLSGSSQTIFPVQLRRKVSYE
jgi:hypothetical protein